MGEKCSFLLCCHLQKSYDLKIQKIVSGGTWQRTFKMHVYNLLSVFLIVQLLLILKRERRENRCVCLKKQLFHLRFFLYHQNLLLWWSSLSIWWQCTYVGHERRAGQEENITIVNCDWKIPIKECCIIECTYLYICTYMLAHANLTISGLTSTFF